MALCRAKLDPIQLEPNHTDLVETQPNLLLPPRGGGGGQIKSKGIKGVRYSEDSLCPVFDIAEFDCFVKPHCWFLWNSLNDSNFIGDNFIDHVQEFEVILFSDVYSYSNKEILK